MEDQDVLSRPAADAGGMVSRHGGGRRRVVVAGTAFGRIYIDAVLSRPDCFQLAGLLAKGSEYSLALAERRGVPLFTDPEQVPDDVDIVCVVVRSGALGGDGAELACGLLKRGFHVLQEHPVHGTEIVDCLRAARAGGTAYGVNTLYPTIKPIRRMLAVAAHLRQQQPLAFIDAACNSQVAYPLIDILGRAAGGLRPWSFRAGPEPAGIASTPFRSLNAIIGGVPTTLRIQNQVHPDDPDNHSYLMHRITLGWEGGVLTLAETHGPVLWNPRLHAPRDDTGRLLMAGLGTGRLAVPSTVTLSDPVATDYHRVFADVWPEAVVSALLRLCRDIEDPARRAASGQWALAVSQAWKDMTAQVGMPELIRPDEPREVCLDALRAAAMEEEG
ncbi:Thiazolinyl imide reductase [Alcanivorax xiamenensis]|uniref:Thiazolinyl imide reductase n=1 Tax=Alcanivorax xiamenensis TaxID=1177156 RepID=A0ABQ6YDN9_9GAMM|nr:Gfo/Idh/MocA family oxidoreductase [Alcanivorax xiamenensis]KAF0808149.1 Thiazolinyl imide reductase [Alcanivorax xiamenensis]